MRKRSKRYKKLIEISKNYKAKDVNEAIDLIKKTATAKFDESIDAAFKINVKQAKTEINLRTVVNLPHGNGKTNKVIILESDPIKLMDRVALSAIKNTIYRPTYIDAEAQSSEGLTIRHEFTYRQAVEEFTEPTEPAIEDKPLENPIA